MRSAPSPVRTWLQLFRAPNLFTVPGDPLAGYLLASFGAIEPALLAAIGASVCLYAAGLLDNDLADLEVDRSERPDRPLPSQATHPRTVVIVAIALTCAGLALAALAGPAALGAALALAAAIALYNHSTKHRALAGPLNMGLCRGLSLLLGAMAVPHGDLTLPLLARGRLDPVLIAFACVTLYIAAVTHLASHETKESAPADAPWLPVALLAGFGLAFLRILPLPQIATDGSIPTAAAITEYLMQLSASSFLSVLFLFGVAVVTSTGIAWRLTRQRGTPIPPMIGQLIRLLLLLQAAFCASTGSIQGALAATGLLLLWPFSRAFSKRFYAS